MKFAGVILLVTCCISSQGLEILDENIQNSHVAIAKYITQAFINRLREGSIRGFSESGKGTRTSLIPPQDDPKQLNTTTQRLWIPFSPLFESSGSLKYFTPVVTGLSNLTDNLVITGLTNLTITWDLELPKIAYTGQYELNQTIVLGEIFESPPPGEHTIKGNGQLDIGADNVFVHFLATGSLLGKLHLDALNVDLGFQNYTGHAENTTMDGEPMSLDNIITIYEKLYQILWTDATKLYVNELIRCMINHVIGDCTIGELLECKLECLNIDLGILTCFTPATTDPTASTVIELTSSTIVSESSDTTTTPKSTTVKKPEPSTENGSAELTGFGGILLVTYTALFTCL